MRGLDASVGKVLGGRYRVRSTLGKGGMAVVYKAEDAILGRTVALKTLRPQYAGDPPFRLRFKQEARAMASLDHENIIKVYDISQEKDAPFIVAEYVEGRDIGKLLEETSDGHLNERFTIRVMTQLLRALSYAHRRGVIHRDIKPSNILITPDGTVKVADFGIARLVEEEDVGRPGEIIGSARYMSPEQLMGGEATPRSDIYSVGVMLYQCLTGRPPFSGDTKSIARQQLHVRPKPPRKLNKEISPHIEEAILVALSKSPEERYASSSKMLDALRSGPYAPAEYADGAKYRAAARGGDARRRRPRRTALLAASSITLAALGLTSAAVGLGYVDIAALNQAASSPAERQNSGTVIPAQRVQQDPVLLPENRVEENAAAERINAPANLVPVPDVDTYYDYSAIEILENRGFRARVVYGYQEGYADRGVAWGTNPSIGTLVPPGSLITIYATPKDLYQPQIKS